MKRPCCALGSIGGHCAGPQRCRAFLRRYRSAATVGLAGGAYSRPLPESIAPECCSPVASEIAPMRRACPACSYGKPADGLERPQTARREPAGCTAAPYSSRTHSAVATIRLPGNRALGSSAVLVNNLLPSSL